MRWRAAIVALALNAPSVGAGRSVSVMERVSGRVLGVVSVAMSRCDPMESGMR
jgi:hypothetical protein